MMSTLVSALGLVRVSKYESLKDDFAQQAQRWREYQCLRVNGVKSKGKISGGSKFKD
jgi:hypothetical protein